MSRSTGSASRSENGPVIRPATIGDAAGCRDVYAPYVRETTVTFEDEVPTVDEFAARISRALDRYDWLVAELDGRIAGYAYAGPVKERAAYAWSCEVSVYVDPDARGNGLGRALYRELFTRLEGLGFRRMLAIITLPNEPSVGMHRALGFREAGRLERIGFKHGRWLDVTWMQADLGPDPAAPPTARPGHRSPGHQGPPGHRPPPG
ncbi:MULTISPECIES: GNAT family N-acetyltransferase [Dietzia]|uniref:N-acetyltransferase family protein n=1 Tax=Dietzia cinnamea TaxID=321318 RepID=A0A4R3ZYD5_9ACTN|nr:MULTISPECIES: GNAT family N-acetyltransferase [Dietzia]MCT1640835.1 N-acetyltransferase family protein [Dietzia cinnamea]MCT1864834.1 N-acetyltransferase family protein [Dietzia cinnamea]MCT1886207.1 N-acetyltransferase family protein [Dietzia cinnamea]MCT2030797.1 N-acetyltransferase family protein [Dietzia cinnamea]MCT2034996.1 N-acetyltransferase family protein [Dietzia cinnamea]